MSRLLRALAVVATLAACSPANAGFTIPVAMMSSQAKDFSFDLTASSLPSGLTMSRTGDTIYAMRSASTVVAVTGADVYEDRGDGRGGGHWVFDAYVNKVAPFDFTDPIWNNVSATITPSIGLGPDGSTQGSRIEDTSNTDQQFLYMVDFSTTSDQHLYSSMFIRDSALNPTATGSASAGNGSYNANFVAGASWHRVSAYWPNSSGNAYGVATRIYPAGAVADDRSSGGAVTYDVTATGAIEAWGAQGTQAAGDVPLVDISTGAATLSVNTPSKALLPNGDLYIEGAYLFQGSRYTQWEQPAWTLGDQFAFKIGTSSGDQALYWSDSNGEWFAKKGDGTTTVALPMFNHLYFNHEVRWEFWNRPSVGDGGANVWFNGCRRIQNSPTTLRWTAVTQNTPTSLYLNSDAGAANSFMVAPVTMLRRIDQPISGRRNVADPDASEGVILGDSIMAPLAYAGPLTGAYIYTFSEGRSRRGIVSYATAGDTITDQFSVWQNNAQRGRSDVAWVIIQVGANDLYGGRTAAQMSTDMIALIADINTQNPGALVLLYPMTPMRASLTSGQYTYWQEFNDDIAGTGPNPVTGTFTRGTASTALNDGSDNLQVQYNLPATDGVHPNDLGRIINATTFRSDLVAAGKL